MSPAQHCDEILRMIDEVLEQNRLVERHLVGSTVRAARERAEVPKA